MFPIRVSFSGLARQLPRIATFAIEERIVCSIEEFPLVGIPTELVAIPVGGIREMDDGGGACSCFHIGQRAFSRVDAIEPIAMVSGRVFQMDFVIREWLLRQLSRIAAQVPTRDPQRSIFAMKGTPVGTAMDDLNAIGVAANGTGMGARIVGRDNFGGAGCIEVQGPLCDIVVVRAHVRVASSGILSVVAPGREVVMDTAWAERGIVGAFRRGTEPEIPIETWLKCLFGQIAGNARAPDSDGDPADLAQATAAHEFHRFSKRPKHVGSLLTPDLHHSLMLSGGGNALLGFGER